MIIATTSHFTRPPQKIISLVPSQTELLWSLGLQQQVTGITKFCVHPQQWFTTKTRVGGTKMLNRDLIKKLSPDLIIANKEENVKEQIEILASEFDVWVTDVNTLEDALMMILDLGQLTHTESIASELVASIKKNFYQLQPAHPSIPAVYLIWKDPYMTVGGDTFINNMMKRCGYQNMYEAKKRYPVVSLQELKESNCQLILLSSEPYPFTLKNVDQLQQQFPGKKIILVDGEMFSWYGSRLLETPLYLKKLREDMSR